MRHNSKPQPKLRPWPSFASLILCWRRRNGSIRLTKSQSGRRPACFPVSRFRTTFAMPRTRRVPGCSTGPSSPTATLGGSTANRPPSTPTSNLPWPMAKAFVRSRISGSSSPCSARRHSRAEPMAVVHSIKSGRSRLPARQNSRATSGSASLTCSKTWPAASETVPSTASRPPTIRPFMTPPSSSCIGCSSCSTPKGVVYCPSSLSATARTRYTERGFPLLVL